MSEIESYICDVLAQYDQNKLKMELESYRDGIVLIKISQNTCSG